jgi:non-ribosomal peptide synthase protein (TIGR01720 family)
VHFGYGGAEPDRLLLICHHLVTDGISRGILLENLEQLCTRLEAGDRLSSAAPRRGGYLAWAERLHRYAADPELLAELPYWLEQSPAELATPDGLTGQAACFGDLETLEHTLTAAETDSLREAARRTKVGMSDVFTWAAAAYLAEWTGRSEAVFATTGHGRERLFPGLDPTRTTGWFQTMYPVRIPVSTLSAPVEAAAATADLLARVPHSGIGYTLLRHCYPDPAVRACLAERPEPWIAVNYMGSFSFDETTEGASLFEVCHAPLGSPQDPRGRWPYPVDLAGWIVGGRLRLGSNHAPTLVPAPLVRALLEGVADRMLAFRA